MASRARHCIDTYNFSDEFHLHLGTLDKFVKNYPSDRQVQKAASSGKPLQMCKEWCTDKSSDLDKAGLKFMLPLYEGKRDPALGKAIVSGQSISMSVAQLIEHADEEFQAEIAELDAAAAKLKAPVGQQINLGAESAVGHGHTADGDEPSPEFEDDAACIPGSLTDGATGRKTKYLTMAMKRRSKVIRLSVCPRPASTSNLAIHMSSQGIPELFNGAACKKHRAFVVDVDSGPESTKMPWQKPPKFGDKLKPLVEFALQSVVKCSCSLSLTFCGHAESNLFSIQSAMTSIKAEKLDQSKLKPAKVLTLVKPEKSSRNGGKNTGCGSGLNVEPLVAKTQIDLRRIKKRHG